MVFQLQATAAFLFVVIRWTVALDTASIWNVAFQPVTAIQKSLANKGRSVHTLAIGVAARNCSTFLGSTLKRDVVSTFAARPPGVSGFELPLLRRFIIETIPEHAREWTLVMPATCSTLMVADHHRLRQLWAAFTEASPGRRILFAADSHPPPHAPADWDATMDAAFPGRFSSDLRHLASDGLFLGAAAHVLAMIDWVGATTSQAFRCDGEAASSSSSAGSPALCLARYAAAHPADVALDSGRNIFVGLADTELRALRWRKGPGWLDTELVHDDKRPAVLFGNRGTAWKVSLVHADEIMLDARVFCPFTTKNTAMQMCPTTVDVCPAQDVEMSSLL